jgi:hypothetical protein
MYFFRADPSGQHRTHVCDTLDGGHYADAVAIEARESQRPVLAATRS